MCLSLFLSLSGSITGGADLRDDGGGRPVLLLRPPDYVREHTFSEGGTALDLFKGVSYGVETLYLLYICGPSYCMYYKEACSMLPCACPQSMIPVLVRQSCTGGAGHERGVATTLCLGMFCLMLIDDLQKV